MKKTIIQYFHSIKGRILACFIVSVFFLAIVISYYFYAFRSSVNRQIRFNFEQVSSEMEHQITERLTLIDQAAKTVGYSNAMQKYLFSSNAPEQIRNKPQAERDMSMWNDMYSYILGLYYISPDFHLYSSPKYARYLPEEMPFLSDETDVELPDSSYSQPFFLNDSHPSCFFYSIPLRNVLYSSTNSAEYRMATAFVLCDLTLLTSLAQIPENSLCAIRSGGQTISSNRPLTLEDENLLWQASAGTESFEYNKHNYLAYSATISATGWELIFITPERSVLDSLLSSQNSMFVLIILGSLLVLLLLLSVIQSVSRSISQMGQDVNRLSDNRSGMQIQEPNTTELRVLAVKINEMLARIDRSVREEEAAKQKLFDAVVAQQTAEITAYRSQINPHFLFNTLECMRSMARYYKAEPVEQLVSSMADLFHYSLYSGNVVTLEQEVGHLRSYMDVMSIRYSGQYEFRSRIAPDTLNHPMPSMLLQPLAENVIKHAFTGAAASRHKIVFLSTKRLPTGALEIRLVDNGRGMTKEELDYLDNLKRLPDEMVKPKKDSIGIQNIFKRLKLYSVHCHINYYAKQDCYTIVEIRIPYLPQ